MVILEFKNVDKYINNLECLKNLNLKINSATKTAIQCSAATANLFMQLILKEDYPIAGEIKLIDQLRVSYVFPNGGVDEKLTTKENLVFYQGLSGKQFSVEEVVEAFGLQLLLHKRVAKLNNSQRMQLKLAIATIKDPQLIIAHEPTQGIEKSNLRCIHKGINYLISKNISFLALTVSREEAILIADKSYTLNDSRLQLIEAVTEELNTKEYLGNDLSVQKIPVKLDNKILLFNPSEIDYIEALSNNTLLFVKGESYTCSISISDLEKRLVTFGFFRNHRSYLVNLQKVTEVVIWSRNAFSLVLSDKLKSSIPISKSRLEILKRLINI